MSMLQGKALRHGRGFEIGAQAVAGVGSQLESGRVRWNGQRPSQGMQGRTFFSTFSRCQTC
eukprot:555303-Pleurochrysis_carterae.AAC.1